MVSDGTILKLEKRIEDLQLSEIEHVIIPHHLQVPESERLGLTFGSFDAKFELRTDPTIKDTATSASEFSQDIEENVEVLSLRSDHPQVSSSIPENQTSKESDVLAEVSPVSEHDPEVPQYSLVHSAPSYPALLLPQLRTGQFPPFESNESQSREATRFPSIVPIKEAAAHGNILANNMDRLTMSCFYLLLARVALQGSISSDMVDPLYYQFLEFKKEEKRKMMDMLCLGFCRLIRYTTISFISRRNKKEKRGFIRHCSSASRIWSKKQRRSKKKKKKSRVLPKSRTLVMIIMGWQLDHLIKRVILNLMNTGFEAEDARCQ